MIPKCRSCGGDLYPYAGCGVGEHGELILGDTVSEVERLRAIDAELLEAIRYVLRQMETDANLCAGHGRAQVATKSLYTYAGHLRAAIAKATMT